MSNDLYTDVSSIVDLYSDGSQIEWMQDANLELGKHLALFTKPVEKSDQITSLFLILFTTLGAIYAADVDFCKLWDRFIDSIRSDVPFTLTEDELGRFNELFIKRGREKVTFKL